MFNRHNQLLPWNSTKESEKRWIFKTIIMDYYLGTQQLCVEYLLCVMTMISMLGVFPVRQIIVIVTE